MCVRREKLDKGTVNKSWGAHWKKVTGWTLPALTHTHTHTHPCVLTGPCPSFRGALGDSPSVMASTPFPVSCLKEITHRPSNSSSHTLTYTHLASQALGMGTDGNSRVNTFFCRYFVFVCLFVCAV